ncbi:hypothetical protein QE152_g6924 [Popillia japonica]|uniref:Uncharacterized protein n=1 Tax=Popillia japonica TaxID=7064 RepID=A0AAW1MFP6_POPJA
MMRHDIGLIIVIVDEPVAQKRVQRVWELSISSTIIMLCGIAASETISPMVVTNRRTFTKTGRGMGSMGLVTETAVVAGSI